MSDLTDEDITCWLREELADPLKQALQELQRRRAEQAAGRDHVERVVREEVTAQFEDFELRYIHGQPGNYEPDIRVPDVEIAIPAARRVAHRLSVPVHTDVPNADVGYIRTDSGMSFAVDIGVPTSADRPRKPSLASRREALDMRAPDEAERRDLLAANIDDLAAEKMRPVLSEDVKRGLFCLKGHYLVDDRHRKDGTYEVDVRGALEWIDLITQEKL